MASDNQNSSPTTGGDAPPLAYYANYFEVGHNAFEFLIDAGQIEPGSGRVNFHRRLAIGPAHAKLLSQLLAQSVDQFETEHGTIPELLDDNPGDLELTSPFEFEQRAIDARRRAAQMATQKSTIPFDKEERQ